MNAGQKVFRGSQVVCHTEHMNDSKSFPTPQSAVDAWYETFVRSEQRDKITPPLVLELSPPVLRFHSEDRPYLEELWAS